MQPPISPPVINTVNNTSNEIIVVETTTPQDTPTGFYRGGDATKTCAGQQGSDCSTKKLCPDFQWLRSKDAKYCCITSCIERVQAPVTITGLGKATVEKIGGQLIVWYGGTPIEFEYIGHPASAVASHKEGSTYQFITNEKQTFTFKVIENTAVTLVVSA